MRRPFDASRKKNASCFSHPGQFFLATSRKAEALAILAELVRIFDQYSDAIWQHSISLYLDKENIT